MYFYSANASFRFTFSTSIEIQTSRHQKAPQSIPRTAQGAPMKHPSVWPVILQRIYPFCTTCPQNCRGLLKNKIVNYAENTAEKNAIPTRPQTTQDSTAQRHQTPSGSQSARPPRSARRRRRHPRGVFKPKETMLLASFEDTISIIYIYI